MRQLFTTEDAAARGITRAALRWGERKGRWRKADRNVYAMGPEPVAPVDQARAAGLATGGRASGGLAAVLLGFDAVGLVRPLLTLPPGSTARRAGACRRVISPERTVVVDGIPCTDGVQTLIDLAAVVDDLVWEQALESALRKGQASLPELEQALDAARLSRLPGVRRIRRVLALRPPGARPTESLLETLFVQLARMVQNLPPPTRQVDVFDLDGNFVARVDLAWPELGVFIELDGRHHAGQPVYDAHRESGVVAAKGWLCARFTWFEVVCLPKTTARRLAGVIEQARRRPLPA